MNASLLSILQTLNNINFVIFVCGVTSIEEPPEFYFSWKTRKNEGTHIVQLKMCVRLGRLQLQKLDTYCSTKFGLHWGLLN